MITIVVKHPSLPCNRYIWSSLNGWSPSLKDWIAQDIAVVCKASAIFYCLNCITQSVSNAWANSHFLKYSSYWLSWLREGLLFGFSHYCTLDVTSSGWMFQTEPIRLWECRWYTIFSFPNNLLIRESMSGKWGVSPPGVHCVYTACFPGSACWHF